MKLYTSEVTHANCWIHARRTFVKAEQIEPDAVAEALTLIGKLYQIEAQIDDQGLTGEKKLKVRSEQSLSVVDEFFARCDEQRQRLASQTDKDETALNVQGSQRKGKKLDKHHAHNSRIVETVKHANVSTCDVCGEPLTDVPCSHHERRTKIDIVFEKVVEHVDAEVKQCPQCNATVKGRFPDDLSGPLQYGEGLKAFVVNLLVGQMVALNRVQKLMRAMMDVVISEATLLKFVLRLHHALDDWEQHAIQQLLKAPVMHVDETSFRVDKKNHWIHVYSSGDVTVKCLHRKRGKDAIEDLNIIPRYGGIIIHDCWASYLSYHDCQHGLCGSHLLRELTFIIDAHDYRWAANMKRLLQETCKAVSQNPEKKLNPKDLANLQKRYRNILTRGEKELPTIPPKPTGKRGKIAKSDAHNLWERLKKYEESVLLFVRHSQVPFTQHLNVKPRYLSSTLSSPSMAMVLSSTSI